MKEEYLKVKVNESTPKELVSYPKSNVTISGGKNSYEIENGYINGLETKSYNIRIWMKESVTQNDEGAMNSTFSSKITITGKYSNKYKESIFGVKIDFGHESVEKI